MDKDRLLVANSRILTGLEDFGDSQLRIYPNPVTNFLKISGLNEKVKITISDLTGRVLYVDKAYLSEQNIAFDDYMPGLYLLTLEKQDKRTIFKVLKK